MLTDLGHAVYVEEFEAPFLAATAEFYKARTACQALALRTLLQLAPKSV
jgi:hypothetical protein